MAEEYWKVSEVTGKRYNLFGVIRILNIKQAAYYFANGMELLHIESSLDRRTGEPVFVYYFDREASKPIYDQWCNRKAGDSND